MTAAPLPPATLAGEPTRLLSTVQTGITLITLAQGAFGESAFTEPLEHWLTQWTWAVPYAKQASTVIVVAIIGMLSLIFGELVPKRIGLLFPEIIARWSARPMLGCRWRQNRWCACSP